jgi:hypothetical protein
MFIVQAIDHLRYTKSKGLPYYPTGVIYLVQNATTTILIMPLLIMTLLIMSLLMMTSLIMTILITLNMGNITYNEITYKLLY